MPRVVSVTANDDYTLLIELDNRHRIIYDVRPRLETVRFCGLADLDRFKAVQVENEIPLSGAAFAR